MVANSPSILEIKSVTKVFPGVVALDGVDFSIRGGEVHGLVGENGAGKSTLIKILMGVYQRDSGQIRIDGQEVDIDSPIDAQSCGLSAVYQDVVIASELSIGENFFLGKLPRTPLGLVDWVAINEESSKYLQSLDIDLDPRRLIKDLLPGEQAMVTIAKIVRQKVRFVIFDEPTARLTNEETRTLFQMIRRLRDEGLGIIYISHHMEEIFEICDRVTVLRDGKHVDTRSIGDVTEDELIAMMVGRSIEEMYVIEHSQPGEVVLEAKNLVRSGRFQGISFQLHRSEVLGLFGLVGSGRTDVLRAIFGADALDEGEVWVNGHLEKISTPTKAMTHGIGLVPEERRLQGLAMPLSIYHNLNITTYDRLSRAGVINKKRERTQASKQVKEMNIRTPSLDQIVSKLSGGNQQKVAIGKWLSRDSNILLLDEPTSGVDVGAKVEIYHLIQKLVKRGKAVILCSSYLPEVIGLADRILVMAEGQLTGEVLRSEANQELLLRLASKTYPN